MKICGIKEKICCVNLAIAVRVIGCLVFFASLVLFVIFVVSMASAIQENVEGEKRNVRVLDGLMLLYSCCYLIASALLIYASMGKKWAFTVPWLVCEILGFSTQVIGLIIYGERNYSTPDAWYFVLTICSLVMEMYLWMTVMCALLEWKAKSSSQPNLTATRPAAPSMRASTTTSQPTPSRSQIRMSSSTRLL